MQKYTHKNLYLAVAAGLGCALGMPSIANAAPAGDNGVSANNRTVNADSLVFTGLPTATNTNVQVTTSTVNIRSTGDTIVTVDSDEAGAFGKFTIIDKLNAGAADDGIWDFDAETGFRSRPSTALGSSDMRHTSSGGLTVTGTGAAANIASVSGANNTTINHAGASGAHNTGTNSHTWSFNATNRDSTITDTAAGGGTNTTTNTATSSSNTVTDGTDTTFRNQTAAAQYDEAKDNVVGGNVASRTQTKFGQTDRAAVGGVGGNSAERRQTATTQDDEIISGANSNRLASNVGNSTRTIVGAGGTTAVSQDDRDWIASTGAGAGSARVAVRNSGGAGNSTAELSVTNSAGNTHGVFVGENSTRISGGTNSTSLAFDDNGAHFRNDSTGGPARVTGIADGVADFDAVNFRQLNNLDKKLTGKINETGAVAAAFAQLGQAQTPGKSTFGIAAGGQGSKAGVALGFSHRPVTMKPVVIKASLGASGKTVAGGVGATWEF